MNNPQPRTARPALGCLLVALIFTAACDEASTPVNEEAVGAVGEAAEAPLIAAAPRPAAVDSPTDQIWLPTASAPNAKQLLDHAVDEATLVNPRAPGEVLAPSVTVERPHFKRVHGADDRRRVGDTRSFPNSAVVSLEMAWGDDWYVCSGSVIADRWVLTAAHCLYSHDRGGWADDIVVIPGRNGEEEPFGRYDWERVHAPTAYLRDGETRFDVALIDVRGNIGDATGWFGYWLAPDQPLLDASLFTAGYPGSDSSRQYATNCQAIEASAVVRHRCDTEGGQSGSPLWVDHERYGKALVGVHSGGNDESNSGARMTPVTYGWMNEARGKCENGCSFESTRCGGETTARVCELADSGCMAWRDVGCGTGEVCRDGGCLCEDDRLEPSTRDRMASLSDGRTNALKVCSGDDDWLRVPARRGERVSIEVGFNHDEGDIDVELFDDSDTLLGHSAGTANREHIEVLAERSGDLRLRVYGHGGAAAAYTVDVARATVAPESWTCDLGRFGVGDGCDCECGAYDPDCDAAPSPARGCADEEACGAAGTCECVPQCDGQSCGSDGCGGTCGDCAEGEACDGGECECVPQCDGRSCGSDGCGGTCGDCAAGASCADGVCEAQTDPEPEPCEGRQCHVPAPPAPTACTGDACREVEPVDRSSGGCSMAHASDGPGPIAVGLMLSLLGIRRRRSRA